MFLIHKSFVESLVNYARHDFGPPLTLILVYDESFQASRKNICSYSHRFITKYNLNLIESLNPHNLFESLKLKGISGDVTNEILRSLTLTLPLINRKMKRASGDVQEGMDLRYN